MTRRAWGSGSVYVRADGRWVGAVRINGRQVASYHKTRKAAKAWVDATALKIRTGAYTAEAQAPLSVYLAQWYDGHAASGDWVVKTQIAYRSAIQRVSAAFGTVRLADLKPGRIEQFWRSLSASGLAPRSVNQIRSVLNAAINDAVRLEIIPSNPVTVTRSSAIPDDGEHAVWDRKQVRAFLHHVRDDRLYAFWLLILTLGLRDGELRGLKWSDVDLTAGEMCVQRSLSQDRRLEGPTKSKRTRVVALGPEHRAALEVHRQQQALEQASAKAWREGEWVFRWADDGRPYHPEWLRKRFYSLTDAIKLPRIKKHDARHTTVTRLLADKVDVATVAAVVGHSNPSTTYRHYAHALRQDQDRARDSISRMLNESDEGPPVVE